MSVYKIIYGKNSKAIYEGEFEGNYRSGLGTLYYPSGKTKYVGEWKEDKPHGVGVLFYESGAKFYEGTWSKGKASGQGVLYFESGDKEYEGQFEMSQKSGEGKSYYKNGTLEYKGEWKEDLKNGEGSLYNKDGILEYAGEFRNGNIYKDEEMNSNDKDNDNLSDQHTANEYDESECINDVGGRQKYTENGEEIYEINNQYFSEEDFDESKFIKQETVEKVYEENIKKAYDEQDDSESEKDDNNSDEYNKQDDNYYDEKDKEDKEENYSEDDKQDDDYIENEEEKYDKQDIDIKEESNKDEININYDDLMSKKNYTYEIKNGKGKIYYNDYVIYEGDIKKGLFDGKGVLFDIQGKKVYEGEFKEGKRNGKGTSYDIEGNIIYDGKWKEDLQWGEGKLLNSNQEKIFEGTFFKGKPLGINKYIEDTLDNIIKYELDPMIALNEVKDDIKRLISYLKVQILRQRVGLRSMQIPYIYVFEGNVGLGKEEVAKILAKIYYTLGLIPEYSFIKRDLVKVLEGEDNSEIEKSMDNYGGGLVYLNNLYSNSAEDIEEIISCKAAIDNILELVDYTNGHFIVVFSGEEELIETMLHSEKELENLIEKGIDFFDYSVDEMMDYLNRLSEVNDYSISKEAYDDIEEFFEDILDDEKYDNRNGEFIQEFFDEMIKEQCVRVDNEGIKDVKKLKEINEEDCRKAEDKICF